MTKTRVSVSGHARRRKARRNLSDADIDFVLDHGRRIHSAGALHIFLGRRNIPRERELYRRYAHLEGAVLVLRVADGHMILITVYRNRKALRSIRSRQH